MVPGQSDKTTYVCCWGQLAVVLSALSDGYCKEQAGEFICATYYF